MPELPEVEITKRSISKHILGKKIKSLKILNPKLRYNLNYESLNLFKNQTIKKINRRSKYILIFFDNENVLLVHLGMTGRFYFLNGDRKIDTSFYSNNKIIKSHDHLKIMFEGFSLIYNDIRKFGFIRRLTISNIKFSKHINKLGNEPLTKEFDFEYLKQKIYNKSSPIKNLLMNQSIIAGLGNIYANEALFMSKIRPNKNGNKLKDYEIKTLVKSINKIIKNAIDAGGSTIKNYHNSEGRSGSYQSNFKVYDRENMKCLRLGCNGKIRRQVSSGRSIFFCFKCQR